MLIDPRQKALWLYELRLNGFIILKNFLPADLVAAMREQFEPLLLGEIARVEAGDASMLRGSRRLSFDLAPYVDRLKGPLDDDRYRRNPIVEELATAFLGRWRHGVTKAEVALPESNTMAWHPDVPNDARRDPSGPVAPARLTFNVPLTDVNDSNGAMEIIPGSHRMHHHDAAEFINDIPQIFPVRVLLRVGDAMVRHGNGLHRGTTNMTRQPRILLDRTYRALEE
jgi:ectoine hydroxylase-related dioxygenase (phytanoyl-CoA dioxygenase family)